MAVVTVKALRYHTSGGAAYDAGDIYDVDESAVENLTVLGMAERVASRVSRAKALKTTAKGKLKPVKVGKGKRGRQRKGK